MEGQTKIPPYRLGNWAMRMKKWRRWAAEMEANGWKVEEPSGPVDQESRADG